MITRRTVIKAGLAAPFASTLLSACGRSEDSMYDPDVYLSGNFAPVEVETTATELGVTGTIPEELVGRYVRNGPNPINAVDASSYHWFLGDGMVHGIRLDGGRADWYRNRWIRSHPVSEALGESPIDRVAYGPNTNVIQHAGRTWAIVESGSPPVELDYELETVGRHGGLGRYTAHPKVDPDSGELHALSYDWANLRDHVEYTVWDANGNVAKNMDIPLAGMPMIHDMSLTQNYVVIYDLPVTISFVALGMGSQFPFRWDDEHEARVGLMPRGGAASDIIWCGLSQQYAYHPMNAYEDDEGRVVIDICRYDRMFAADTNGPFGDSLPRFARWTANPKTRTVSEETVDDREQEFPRCHPSLNSKPYRYGYTLASSGTSFPAVYKHDMRTGESWSFDFGPGRHGGEPYFFPKAHAQAEDDGYIMTLVYDEGTKRSDLTILDAQDFSRPEVARVHLPVRVPYGFHGNWMPDAASV